MSFGVIKWAITFCRFVSWRNFDKKKKKNTQNIDSAIKIQIKTEIAMRQNGCQRMTIRLSERKVEFLHYSSPRFLFQILVFQFSIFDFQSLIFLKYISLNFKKKSSEARLIKYIFAQHFSRFCFQIQFGRKFKFKNLTQHFSSFDFPSFKRKVFTPKVYKHKNEFCRET